MKNFLLVFFLILIPEIIFCQTPCPTTPVINYGGKIYNTIQIGDQWWLRENLQIGIMISGNLDASDNGVIEKYYFNNDSVHYGNYGAYYQWNEAMQYSTIPGARGICPEGWHIPTSDEFQKLCDFVQNDGNALKVFSNGGTDAYCFSAYLSGYRGNDGSFMFLNSSVRFWTSTQSDSISARTILLYGNNSNIGYGSGDKEFGYCVRCLKNSELNSVEDEEIPQKFELFQNYPNPFNMGTVIKYQLPEFTHVSLKVFDTLGNEVTTLVNEYKQPGNYSSPFNPNNSTPSGVYFYQLKASSFVKTRKMMFIK